MEIVQNVLHFYMLLTNGRWLLVAILNAHTPLRWVGLGFPSWQWVTQLAVLQFLNALRISFIHL